LLAIDEKDIIIYSIDSINFVENQSNKCCENTVDGKDMYY